MASKKSVNPFDALASAPKASSKTSTKIAATVDDKIKGMVDIIIKAKATIDTAQQEKDSAELEVISFIRPQQDKLARSGTFTKSLLVQGNTGSLTYVTQDKWVCPQDSDTREAIKDLIGDKKFEEMFQTVRTIALKPAVQENTDLINKIVKAVTDAGISIGDAFEVSDKFITKKALDEKIYELPEKKVEELRSLVKQYKPAVR